MIALLFTKLKTFVDSNITTKEIIEKLTDAEKLEVSRMITDMQLNEVITNVLNRNN